MSGQSGIDALKQAAAEAAADIVENGMTVGLGTGSTAKFAIEALIRRVREGLQITAIPTSERSAVQARDGGIRLGDFEQVEHIDLTIDGADQVTPRRLDLIKGMGGALLREKIVAAASAQLVIIVDDTKLTERLSLPVPVEVVEFGWQATARAITKLGGLPELRQTAGRPYRTDGGNLILDCDFKTIDDPGGLEERLRAIVGVVESGLFVGRADRVLIAAATGVREIRRG